MLTERPTVCALANVKGFDVGLPMPGGSWATIQKILKAYNTVRNRDKPTIKQVADLAGLHRPNVSTNNNFLRDLGLLQEEENKLSPLGTRLATGLELNNQSMINEAVQESIQKSPGLSQLLDMLRARGTMTLEAFEGYVVTLAKITAETSAIAFVSSYAGTIIDYFVAGNLVQEDGSNLIYMRPKEDQLEGRQRLGKEQRGLR